jgi:hypothetical protein
VVAESGNILRLQPCQSPQRNIVRPAIGSYVIYFEVLLSRKFSENINSYKANKMHFESSFKQSSDTLDKKIKML